MPFFCGKGKETEFSFEMINQIIRQFINVNKTKKQKVVTLQVRIPRNKNIRSRKRASFSASASMTVEAAFVLPLFLFAGIVLLMPFQILDMERQIQAHIETVGEDISQSAYFSLGEIPGKEVLTVAAAYGYAEAAVRIKLRDLPVKNISLHSSSLLEDGETVDLVVNYEFRLPFSVFGLKNVKRISRCYRRAWIGKDGSKKDGQGNVEKEEDLVYIGKNSTRYHESRTCHYLYNDLKTVPLSRIDGYRNEVGKKYTPCSRCGALAGGNVYITPSGNHYHSSGFCTAIQAYVSSVSKSQVEHLGPCSYCSGGK